MHPNVWPQSPFTENLESAFKALGSLISGIATHIARHCDALVQEVYPNGGCLSLHETLSKSRASKGRLLYYYPRSNKDASKAEATDLWCGYHNDHSTLTGLLPAEFYLPDGGPATKPPPDLSGGLCVLPSGADVPLRVCIPPDCIAFQIGESAQIATGGALRATPHFVKRPSPELSVARVTLAVFLQPNPWDILHLPPGADASHALYTGPNICPLPPRFKDGDLFGTFSTKTLAVGSGHQQLESDGDKNTIRPLPGTLKHF